MSVIVYKPRQSSFPRSLPGIREEMTEAKAEIHFFIPLFQVVAWPPCRFPWACSIVAKKHEKANDEAYVKPFASDRRRCRTKTSVRGRSSALDIRRCYHPLSIQFSYRSRAMFLRSCCSNSGNHRLFVTRRGQVSQAWGRTLRTMLLYRFILGGREWYYGGAIHVTDSRKLFQLSRLVM